MLSSNTPFYSTYCYTLPEPNESEDRFPIDGEKTLFLGEGNFSFSLAWLDKHMEALRAEGRCEEAERLPKTLIATEYKTRSKCEEDPFTLKNIQKLEELGSLVLFEVDGQSIDTNPDLKRYRFARVQANCLDNGHLFCDDDCQLPNIIQKTARAASQMLAKGKTFQLITLSPEPNQDRWQAVHYELPRIEDKGFYLNEGAPRHTGQDEYPSYVHNKTRGNEKVEAAQSGQMAKYVYVRHPTQRTPENFMGSIWGHKQTRSQYIDPETGKHLLVHTQHRYYPYYSEEPGSPRSPTIFPPSFFNFEPPVDKQKTDEADEIEEILDEFDLGVAFGDYSHMNVHQMNAHLRRRCNSLVKMIKR